MSVQRSEINYVTVYINVELRIMKEFFKVTPVEKVLEFIDMFSLMEIENIPIIEAGERILGEDIISDMNLPDFTRSTMDGYAIKASSSFGASNGTPAFLTVKGNVLMGEEPDFIIKSGEAAKISTGGMLPKGADSVVMIEYVEEIDNSTVEIYKSVAPGQHIIKVGEDFKKDEVILKKGCKIKAQEMGLLAAFGYDILNVYKKPVVAIISTGDEIVPINQKPTMGNIRDINSYSLFELVKEAGAIPLSIGILEDNFDSIYKCLKDALSDADMVIVSGGSSVGTRDFTIDVLLSFPNTKILTHGISISPGKPTILAKSNNKPVWGLPGHVVSAMIVFKVIVSYFIKHIGGLKLKYVQDFPVTAYLTRNISSAQGRVDYIRVKLINKENRLMAEPVLGKSGMINTMIKADGLIEIEEDNEGLNKNTMVQVMLLR